MGWSNQPHQVTAARQRRRRRSARRRRRPAVLAVQVRGVPMPCNAVAVPAQRCGGCQRPREHGDGHRSGRRCFPLPEVGRMVGRQLREELGVELQGRAQQTGQLWHQSVRATPPVPRLFHASARLSCPPRRAYFTAKPRRTSLLVACAAQVLQPAQATFLAVHRPPARPGRWAVTGRAHGVSGGDCKPGCDRRKCRRHLPPLGQQGNGKVSGQSNPASPCPAALRCRHGASVRCPGCPDVRCGSTGGVRACKAAGGLGSCRDLHPGCESLSQPRPPGPGRELRSGVLSTLLAPCIELCRHWIAMQLCTGYSCSTDTCA